MILDVYLTVTKPTCVFEYNITHNLNKMASEAGIYQYLWRPDETGVVVAHELIEPLMAGLKLLKAEPEHFKQFEPPNGWGSYEGLVVFVEKYLEACIAFPDATIDISR